MNKQTITNDLPWIQQSPDSPYFITDSGKSWTPVGQNDAITWPELEGLFRRKNTAAVEAYFDYLVQHGVTCLRLMLEYCQGSNRYFENPVGQFVPNMVRLWDDLFALCREKGLRLLLTPYDTFWMWRRWQHHPYHTTAGGPCARRSQWLLCPATRQVIKARLLFATERWGGSGVLFGWDLWNEIRPAHSGNSAKGLAPFVADVSSFLYEKEMALHGRAHLQTVSLFNPVWQKHSQLAGAVFGLPHIHFASLHLYEKGALDSPRNTVDAAMATGRLVKQMLEHLPANMPFLDTEHGPIGSYGRRRASLPQLFDDEYFLHMQWAHLASGGAGGGMRWPYRQPHSLTPGMRQAQAALARFLPLIHWSSFDRTNVSAGIMVTDEGLVPFGCANEAQAVVWLLRTNARGTKGMVSISLAAAPFYITIPLLQPGHYKITCWDTAAGCASLIFDWACPPGQPFRIQLPPVATNLAIAIRPTEI